MPFLQTGGELFVTCAFFPLKILVSKVQKQFLLLSFLRTPQKVNGFVKKKDLEPETAFHALPAPVTGLLCWAGANPDTSSPRVHFFA